MSRNYSSGSFVLLGMDENAPSLGVLKNGEVRLRHGQSPMRVYANQLFVDLGDRHLGEHVGEIDDSGVATGDAGTFLFRVRLI
ncbi:MAG: hypothetical protein GAK44_00129 [Pseudomonas delhiensis]|nr:MAG: hypothetical protein GAK44_00129 [Pseudomonas delhiensis]